MTDTSLYEQAQQALSSYIHKREAAAKSHWLEVRAEAELFIRDHLRPQLLEATNKGGSRVEVPFDPVGLDLKADDALDVAEAVVELLVQKYGFPSENVEKQPDGCFVLKVSLNQPQATLPQTQPKQAAAFTPNSELASRYNSLLSHGEIRRALSELEMLYNRDRGRKTAVDVKVSGRIAQTFAEDSLAWQAFAEAAASRLNATPSDLSFDPEPGLITLTLPNMR